MAAVTQRINSYLGGVSKQSDNKMLPGQVRECYNGFPDATYGLTKRPGFKHIVNLGSGNIYDNAKWFYIKRDDDEEYVGCIKGSNIYIWNALTGNTCSVTYGAGSQSYLNGTRDNYKVITVQDTSIIINNSVIVAQQTPPTYNFHRNATVEVQYLAVSSTYSIDITINGVTQTATYTTPSSADVNSLLSDLESDINSMTGDHAQLTVIRLSNSLEIVSTLFMDVHAQGGLDNLAMTVVEDEVATVSNLPLKSTQNRILKIVNTDSNGNGYWAKFVAHDGVSGEGYWEETIAPDVSRGLDISTMPHELVNTAVDTFVFQTINFEDRLVGDDTTNSQPSFYNNKISAGFFHSNRLGFLSNDNVIMSQSGDFYNFYFKSAQTTIESDPIDISCSSVRPTSLYAVIPTAQGVVLFSENQQFIMFADAGVLTPSLTTIRALSNYEMDRKIDPVDVGVNINFITKTPGYSRVFSMITRGQQDNPQILDISKVVKEWISENIDTIVASPQNSMIAMSGQSLNEIFIFRYYNDGKENVMESWVSWLLPGTVQFIETNSDDMYAVTKQGNQFTLSKATLSQSPDQAIIVNNQGVRVNPTIDLYATASSVTYDANTATTKCYLPYNDVPTLTPIIVIKGTTQSGSFVESGFTVTPDRGTDGIGDYFSIANKDLSGVASDVIVGFKYNFDVELPRTYFRPDPRASDFTANLTIARMKFAVGLSGMMSFKLQQTGRIPYELHFTGDGTTTTYTFNKKDLDYIDRSEVTVSVNGVVTTDYSFSNDTTIVFNTPPANGVKIRFFIRDWYNIQPVIESNSYLANDVPLDNETIFTIPIHQRTENFRLKMFNNSPFPVAINAMMWEGNYTPRFYRRV